MSTRAIYSFIDGRDTHHVYKHYDGYPEEGGAYDHIRAALSYAWPLPRFEADDFAAAFIAANKHPHGGDVYCLPSGEWRNVAPCDLAYRYEIRHTEKALTVHVKGFTVQCKYPENTWVEEPLTEQAIG